MRAGGRPSNGGAVAVTSLSASTAGPVRGRVAVEAAVEERARTGAWRLPAFATNGDARLFQKLSRVRELLHALSPAEARAALGPGAAEAAL